jgi:hypothetical protein
MLLVGIILTIFFEQRNLLIGARSWFNRLLLRYISMFISKEVNTQRQIRYIYLFACLPVIVLLILFKLTVGQHHIFIYFLVKIILFILSIEVLTWKEEAKTASKSRNFYFIETYAVKFFAALFWYLVLPTAIGLICYLIITMISTQLKNKNPDSVIYNVVIDKMLFYANILPYSCLFLFIAIAGNFEDVTHHLISQRKNFVKSFLFLDNLLKETVFYALGKEKFKLDTHNYSEATEADELDNDKFSPKIVEYIVAVLYRVGIFFIIIAGLLSIANLLR